MTLELFSDGWARACAAGINANLDYRAAAATWEGAVLLVMTPEPGLETRAVYFDLWHGDCRAGRAAEPHDVAEAAYVIEATAAAWRQVLEGRMAPLLAIMTGRLVLTKGSLAGLVPYLHAARELVVSAMSVETRFPDLPA